MTRLELEINSLFMAYKRQQEESERKFLEEIQAICESCLNEVSQYAEIKSDPSEKWLRASELAEHFNVSSSTVYDWEKRGVIPKGTQFGKRQNRWKVSEVENFNSLAWKLGKLEFKNTPMKVVVNQLSKLYDFEYCFESDDIANMPITGEFENQSLESVLSVLEQTLEVNIVKESQYYKFKK